MPDQTNNEISYVQSKNKARLHENKIELTTLTSSPLEPATKIKLVDKADQIGVDSLRQQIRLFFKTPFDQLKKL